MPAKFTYRNKSELPQSIPNLGTVMPGKTIESDTEIINANFEKVDAPAASQAPAAASQQPVAGGNK